MRGNITRRGERSWRIKYDAGRDASGKRKIVFQTVRGTKREAQAALTAALASLQNGGWVEPDALSVSGYLEKWLADHARITVSTKTFEFYEHLIQTHLVPRLGAHRLQKLTPLHIPAYAEMLATGRRDGAGGLSARTVRHAHAILFAALKQAVRWQLLSRNPAEAVTPPSVADRQIAVFDDAQIGALLKAARPTRLYTPILVAVTTGLRRGELLGLRWSDVNLPAARLTVAQAIEQTRSKGLGFKAPKTRRGKRTLSLPAVTVEALRAHKAAQAAERLALGLGKDDRGLVFTTAEGEPMDPRGVTQHFARIVSKAGLPAVTFHGLRHTHLTALLRAGVHPKIASERAGHASIAITMDTYSHAIPSMQDDLVHGIDATIRKVM